jgi:protoheme IX farnesyltransferase
MAHTVGKTLREGDPEVSEAIDFATYAAHLTHAHEARGLGWEPYPVTLVAGPWNFPYAIPANGLVHALAAGGAAVLNQWLEREADAKMVRTRNRPIPSGQIAPYNALMFGLGLSIFGAYLLYAGANPLAGTLTAATIASYVLLYTPLKKLTTWNTLVGAVPGALPPLIGWAAAEGRISMLGWILFAILFLWQMPHFFAIAWTYRKDYKKGGFVMLSNADSNGAKVARQSFAFACALVASTLLPALLGYASWGYGAVAVIAGCYLLRPAWRFLDASQRDTAARRLFIASIFYLPALLIPLVLDLWLV